MNDLTHISLFTGIGGFDLAATWAGFRTVAMCEIDEFCQEVLKARFGAVEDAGCGLREGAKKSGIGNTENGHRPILPERPTSPSRPLLFPDIFAFDGTRFRGATLLTGGFPCQPFSHAGKRRGKEDDRAIWPQMLRVIHEARPAWVIGENVSGLISMELDQVLADLELEGYAARTFHIGAVGVNAPHRRMRVWIVGHLGDAPLRGCERGRQDKMGCGREMADGFARTDSDAPDAVLPKHGSGWTQRDAGGKREDTPDDKRWDIPWIEVATRFCRVDDGLPAWIHARRVARLKALGNAIVPQVAYQIIKAIAEIERGMK